MKSFEREKKKEKNAEKEGGGNPLFLRVAPRKLKRRGEGIQD